MFEVIVIIIAAAVILACCVIAYQLFFAWRDLNDIERRR